MTDQAARATQDPEVIRRTLSLGPRDCRQAAAMLARGELVAFPTETVYGLGADATSASAVASLYAAKGRPSFNPLIAHVASIDPAISHGVFDASALTLAQAFWPGPLTLVVPLRTGSPICDLARAGLDTVALRVPNHPVALAILRAASVPIAAPSANRSGALSPTTAAHVLDDLDGTIDAVLDGGATAIGLESTIVACLGATPVLLRAGGIARVEIERVLGHRLDRPGPMANDCPLAPGGLASHYAPRARLRMNALTIDPDEAGLLFGNDGERGSSTETPTLNLSPTGDLVEAAANLFAFLHALDRTGIARIAVAPIPMTGLGEAINDRLRRASVRNS